MICHDCGGEKRRIRRYRRNAEGDQPEFSFSDNVPRPEMWTPESVVQAVKDGFTFLIPFIWEKGKRSGYYIRGEQYICTGVTVGPEHTEIIRMTPEGWIEMSLWFPAHMVPEDAFIGEINENGVGQVLALVDPSEINWDQLNRGTQIRVPKILRRRNLYRRNTIHESRLLGSLTLGIWGGGDEAEAEAAAQMAIKLLGKSDANDLPDIRRIFTKVQDKAEEQPDSSIKLRAIWEEAARQNAAFSDISFGDIIGVRQAGVDPWDMASGWRASATSKKTTKKKTTKKKTTKKKTTKKKTTKKKVTRKKATRTRRSTTVCIMEGCVINSYGKPLCRRHYYETVDRPFTEVCQHPGCEELSFGKPLCRAHYYEGRGRRSRRRRRPGHRNYRYNPSAYLSLVREVADERKELIAKLSEIELEMDEMGSPPLEGTMRWTSEIHALKRQWHEINNEITARLPRSHKVAEEFQVSPGLIWVGRHIVVVKTSEGNIAFYRSSGKNTGKWTEGMYLPFDGTSSDGPNNASPFWLAKMDPSYSQAGPPSPVEGKLSHKVPSKGTEFDKINKYLKNRFQDSTEGAVSPEVFMESEGHPSWEEYAKTVRLPGGAFGLDEPWLGDWEDQGAYGGLAVNLFLTKHNVNFDKIGGNRPSLKGSRWGIEDVTYGSMVWPKLEIRSPRRNARRRNPGDNYRRNTVFWGKEGAGILPIAKSTGRILVGLRSWSVNEPYTWGVFGGRVERGEGPKVAAIRETKEETGYIFAEKDLIPGYGFISSDFEYHNFIGLAEEEFTPILNSENEEAKWMTLKELWELPPWREGCQGCKHFGLEAFLKNSSALIERVVSKYDQ